MQKWNKLSQWVGAHQDELGVLVHQAFTTAFTFGTLKAGSIILKKGLKWVSPGGRLPNTGAMVGYGGPPKTSFSVSALSKELGYVGLATGLGAATYLGLQQVKLERATIRRIVEGIKDPERKKAAILLQQNYTGLQVSEQELAGLMRAAPIQLDATTGMVSGALGTVYYDTLDRGQVSLQRILPALGQELSLQKGLDRLKDKLQPSTLPNPSGSAVPSIEGL